MHGSDKREDELTSPLSCLGAGWPQSPPSHIPTHHPTGLSALSKLCWAQSSPSLSQLGLLPTLSLKGLGMHNWVPAPWGEEGVSFLAQGPAPSCHHHPLLAASRGAGSWMLLTEKALERDPPGSVFLWQNLLVLSFLVFNHEC